MALERDLVDHARIAGARLAQFHKVENKVMSA